MDGIIGVVPPRGSAVMFVYDYEAGEFVAPVQWTEELDIDRLLVHHPNLLAALLEQNREAGHKTSDLVIPLAAKFIGGQLRGIDLLALHRPFPDPSSGVPGGPPRLVLVENKRGGNPELTSRKALGQLLEYAAALDRMGIEEFKEEITRRVHGPEWQRTYEGRFDRKTQEAVITTAVEAFEARKRVLVWCADEFPRRFVDTLRWLGEKLRLVDLPPEGVDITQVGTQRPLVTATALAALMTSRDKQALETTADLDRDLADVARVLLGKPEAWFAELKRIDEQTLTVRGKPATDAAEEKSGTNIKTAAEFLELAEAKLDAATLRTVNAVIDRFQHQTTKSPKVEMRGLSKGMALCRTYGPSSLRILSVYPDGQVRFVFHYLEEKGRKDLADGYRKKVAGLADQDKEKDTSRGIYLSPANLDNVLALVDECISWLDDQLSKPSGT